MASYIVMAKPEDATREDAVFVRESFNAWAVIFGPIWALAKRMWIVAIVLGCASILTGLLPPLPALLANAGLLLATAIFASDLELWSLRRRGFEEQAQLTAANAEEAELRYFLAITPSAQAEVQSRTSAPYQGLQATDPLGLFGTGG